MPCVEPGPSVRVFICPDDIVNPSLIVPAGPDYAGPLGEQFVFEGRFQFAQLVILMTYRSLVVSLPLIL